MSGASSGRSTADAPALSPEAWLERGRKTVTGYLMVIGGTRKKRLGLLDGFIADILEESTGRSMARWPDCHAVWFDKDESKDPGKQMLSPMLRYKATRPIDGLGRDHNGHRVELTCSVGDSWKNGIGAYITRAVGRCITCEEAAGASGSVVSDVAVKGEK